MNTRRPAILASSAPGAKVEQYVASAAIFDTVNYTVVGLPGHWSGAGPVNQRGEGNSDGFHLEGNATGGLVVRVSAPSYDDMTSIIITRTIATTTVSDTTLQTVPSSGSASAR